MQFDLSRLFRMISVPWLVLALAAAEAGAQDLDPAQQKLLNSAQYYVKRGRTSLDLAMRGIPRSGPVARGRAKLALSRLGGVKRDLANAGATLKKLPDGNASVAAVAKNLDAMNKAVAAFETRLTGGAPSSGAPSAGKKLDYRDEKKLKDAQFYVRELGGMANALENLVKKVGAAKNKDHLDHRLLAQGIGTVQKARQRAGFIKDGLAALPPDGRGVKSTGEQFTKLAQRVEASAKILAPVHARLQKIIHPSTYPTFDADLKRVRELSSMFGRAEVFQQQPEKAARIAAQLGAARKELGRVARHYDLLSRQQTELSKRITGAVRGLNGNLVGFAKEIENQKTSLPKQIQTDLAAAAKMANEAVEKKKPLWFTGGIPQRMGWVDTKLTLLTALDPAGAKPVQATVQKAKDTLRKQQESLRTEIIKNNNVPPDRYTGQDRKDVIARAIAAWKKEQPNAEILGAVIPSEMWERETMWRLQNTTWYRIDRSKLQVQLLVRHDAELAVIRAINMWIDHQKGGKKTQFPLWSLKDSVPPNFFLLASKIKKK